LKVLICKIYADPKKIKEINQVNPMLNIEKCLEEYQKKEMRKNVKQKFKMAIVKIDKKQLAG
jgi:hypothetical protein